MADLRVGLTSTRRGKQRARRPKSAALSTAAGIWATAAVGVTVGLGREGTALVITLMTLLVLSAMLRLKGTAHRSAEADTMPNG